MSGGGWAGPVPAFVLLLRPKFAAFLRLEHDPEKWSPVFGQDHAHALNRTDRFRESATDPMIKPVSTAARRGALRALALVAAAGLAACSTIANMPAVSEVDDS